MKRCTKCETDKPLDLFPANKNTKDGKGSWCKACVSANTAAYLKTDKGKQKQREYFQSDKGKAALARGMKKQLAAGYYRFGKGAIHILRQGAVARGLNFELTADALKVWWGDTPDQCAYCGITTAEFIRLRDFILAYAGNDYEVAKFRRVFSSSKHAGINWLTLDRVDNALGYEFANLVKSCWFCNSIKGSLLTHQDMVAIAPAIMKRLQTHVAAANEVG
jgi:hypothetical protein